jgi:hypothetical protein
MSPKQKNQQAQKLMCLSFLLLETLDDLKVTEHKIVKYKQDLTGFIEALLIQMLYNTLLIFGSSVKKLIV